MRTFFGGVHPNDNKKLTNSASIEIFKTPEKVVIPFSQHLGKPAIPCINAGDSVEVGKLIAKADGFISANVHSSVSGTVSEICSYNHPVSGYAQAAVIKTDFSKPQEFNCSTKKNYSNLSTDELKKNISDAGIVGLGGATFPTIVKLSPPPEKKIDTIIINGVECEPYLTADHRLMLEYTENIIEGAEIIKKVLNVEKIFIGIEANKPDAYKKFAEANTFLKPVILKVKYPQGAEKQLIDAVTGRKIPPAKLPMDVGVVVVNAGTVFAIYEAVAFGKPLIDRILTVSGAGIQNPKNLKCKIGSLWSEILNFCGGLNSDTKRLIMGGPMMGVSQFTDDVPVIKGVSGILALTEREVLFADEEPCIRCGKCVRGCPMNLMPSEINRACDQTQLERLYKLNLSDCIECGTCSYICPANKKIVQKIRKYKIRTSEWAKKNVASA